MSEHIAILDVAYSEVGAGIACVLSEHWNSDTPTKIITKRLEGVAKPYVSGNFYKRELPFLIDLLKECSEAIGIVVIDGYVWTGLDRTPGLGAALHEAMDQKVPVVGVAKNRLHKDNWSSMVFRGNSKRALFVTAVGVDQGEAVAAVGSMHGNHRIPTLISLTDRAARKALLDTGEATKQESAVK